MCNTFITSLSLWIGVMSFLNVEFFVLTMKCVQQLPKQPPALLLQDLIFQSNFEKISLLNWAYLTENCREGIRKGYESLVLPWVLPPQP